MPSGPSPTVRTKPAASTGASSGGGFVRAKHQLVLACAGIGAGLAVAGSVDRTIGGVLLLAGWVTGVVALHRIGRSGADRGSDASA